MNGTLESPVEVKSERGKSFSHTAEISPFFEGVFRRYHVENRPTKFIDVSGLTYGKLYFSARSELILFECNTKMHSTPCNADIYENCMAKITCSAYSGAQSTGGDECHKNGPIPKGRWAVKIFLDNDTDDGDSCARSGSVTDPISKDTRTSFGRPTARLTTASGQETCRKSTEGICIHGMGPNGSTGCIAVTDDGSCRRRILEEARRLSTTELEVE
jgi:hypothetical protein